MKNPDIYLSTEPREAGHYFTADQLKRFNQIYASTPASNYTEGFYAAPTVAGLEAELNEAKRRIDELQLALGGLLYDFDDGVNGGSESRLKSLDFARTVCPALKFKKSAATRLQVSK